MKWRQREHGVLQMLCVSATKCTHDAHVSDACVAVSLCCCVAVLLCRIGSQGSTASASRRASSIVHSMRTRR